MVLDYLKNNSEIKKAINFLKEIENCGYQAFIVGGVVRDMIRFKLGQLKNAEFHDIDIATNMPIEKIQEHFTTQSNNGEKHGTILVNWENTYYEVTQFRIDGTYSDGRHPDFTTTTSNFQEDVLRRDFTINALGLDSSYCVVDYVNGINDIVNKTIRAVGDPMKRFSEDRLRILRALRFQSQLGYNIEMETYNSISTFLNNSNSDVGVAVERSISELLKIKWNKETLNTIQYLNILYMFLKENWLSVFHHPFDTFLNLKNDFELSGEEFFIFLITKKNKANYSSSIENFRMSSDNKKACEFIITNEDLINNFWKEPSKTLKAFQSKYFPLLYKYWELFKNEKLEQEQENITIFQNFVTNNVLDEKLINKIICSKDYKGAKIGKIKNQLIDFYLTMLPVTPITENFCKVILDVVDGK